MLNLTKGELLIKQLLDVQTDSALWMKPLYQDNTRNGVITDFVVCYYNKSAAIMMGFGQQADLEKHLIKDNLLKGDCEQTVFAESVYVYENNTSKESSYYNDYLQKHVQVVSTRVNDGVLSIQREVDAERKLQEQAELLNTILDTSINAVFVCEAIRNENGKIEDLRIIKINRAFTEVTGKNPEEVEGKKYLSLFPTAKDTGVFDLNCTVIETGERTRKEIYYKGENLDDWYDISLAKIGENRLLVTFTVITQEKQSLSQIQQQSTLLDNILKYSPSGICVVNIIRNEDGVPIDGAAILANEAATQITGISKELITNKISLIDAKILSNELFKEAASTLQTGKPFLAQYYLKSLHKWLELGISKMDDEHLIIVFTDITSSKTVQLEVERSADQLLNFINTAHSGISYLLPVKDKDGGIIDFRFGITNNAFAAYSGQQPETVKNKLVSEYYPAYKNNGLFEQYKCTYQTGETSRFEMHYIGEDIDAWFDIMSTKMEDGVLVTLNELTTLKKLQIDLETLINQLKKSNENLQEFAYVASHDLQEPLRKIQVFSERLQKDVAEELSEENKKVFGRMIAATQRMSQLINDLLSYSQLSTKPSAFKTISLKDLLQQVITDLEATVNEKKAVISAGELPHVKGDPVQLRQLFQNLISNSLKYSKEEIPPVISLKWALVKKEINGLLLSFHEIEIKDNGIGFEQEEVERIFKVFQRLHGRSEYPGTGIGLAIVQKVVENHNGIISAESEPGKGATFRVYLPE